MYRIDRSHDAARRPACAAAWGRRTSTWWSTRHLHFDHAGGNTRLDGGRVVPTFPRARYVVQRGEWEDAHPSPRAQPRLATRADDFVPLAEADQLDLMQGEAEVAPGVRAVRVGGHTTHHQMVVVEDGGETLVVPTDLLPTAAHLPLPFVMGYDLFPVATPRGQAAACWRRRRRAAGACSSTMTRAPRSDGSSAEGPHGH